MKRTVLKVNLIILTTLFLLFAQSCSKSVTKTEDSVNSAGNTLGKNESSNDKVAPFTVFYADTYKTSFMINVEWENEQYQDINQSLPQKKFTFKNKEYTLKHDFSVKRSHEDYIVDNNWDDARSTSFTFDRETGKIMDYADLTKSDSNTEENKIETDEGLYTIIKDFLNQNEVGLDFDSFNHIEKRKINDTFSVTMSHYENGIYYGDIVYFEINENGLVKNFNYSKPKKSDKHKTLIKILT